MKNSSKNLKRVLSQQDADNRHRGKDVVRSFSNVMGGVNVVPPKLDRNDSSGEICPEGETQC